MCVLQTKAALTRQYNKSSHKLHYAVDVAAPVKKKKTPAAAADVNEGEGEEASADSDYNSDEDVVKALQVV